MQLKEGEEAMRTNLLLIVLVVLLFTVAGCASNPDAAGQVLSGVLMGIGTGLSSL